MDLVDDINLIIVAAGSGKRFGNKEGKLFIELDSVPIIFYSVEFFLSYFNSNIFLVLSDENREQLLSSDYLSNLDMSRIKIIDGGKERSNSVFNGLNYIKENSYVKKFVMIHDSARPILDINVVDNLIKKSQENPAAIIPTLPVNDTICKINGSSIVDYPNRSLFRRVQTPQVFNFEILYNSLKKLVNSGEKLSDESSLILKSGYSVTHVEGSEKMLKLTYKEDLKVLESYIKESKNVK